MNGFVLTQQQVSRQLRHTDNVCQSKRQTQTVSQIDLGKSKSQTNYKPLKLVSKADKFCEVKDQQQIGQKSVLQKPISIQNQQIVYDIMQQNNPIEIIQQPLINNHYQLENQFNQQQQNSAQKNLDPRKLQFGSSYSLISNHQIPKKIQNRKMVIMRASKDDRIEQLSHITEEQEKVEQTITTNNVPKFTAYSWLVLLIVVMVRVIVQWQRSFISFAYGYTGTGLRAFNPVYEIVVAFPQLKNYFGLLTGLLYTIPFAIFGMIIGKNSDKMNRKQSLALFIMLAGLTIGVSSFQSFTVFSIMRILHGIFNAGTNPFSYSLITEYFPPDKRAIANSLIHSGTYIGNSISSISILLVTKHGWRFTYGIMGIASILISILIILLIKEPERGRYASQAEKLQILEQQKREKEQQANKSGINGINIIGEISQSIKKVLENPTARYALLGGFLRNFAGCIVMYYLPVFYGKNFPIFKSEYACYNALINCFCGIFASVISGILADVLEKKTFWAKSIILMIFQSMSIPVIFFTCGMANNFWLSIISYSVYHFLASTYAGPCMTMMQNSSTQGQQKYVVSSYFFVVTMAQTFAPALFDLLSKAIGASNNPALLGPLIAAFVGICYSLSIPCWYMAGKHYNQYMIQKNQTNLIPS